MVANEPASLRSRWLSIKEVPKTDSDGGGSCSGSGMRRGLDAWHSADAYAFSLLMWETMTLRRPWRGLTIAVIWARVQSGVRPAITAEDAAAAPDGYVSLVRQLWAQDPVERPTFAAALEVLRGILDALENEQPRVQQQAPQSPPLQRPTQGPRPKRPKPSRPQHSYEQPGMSAYGSISHSF